MSEIIQTDVVFTPPVVSARDVAQELRDIRDASGYDKRLKDLVELLAYLYGHDLDPEPEPDGPPED